MNKFATTSHNTLFVFAVSTVSPEVVKHPTPTSAFAGIQDTPIVVPFWYSPPAHVFPTAPVNTRHSHTSRPRPATTINTGAIVGGIFGGCILLVAVVVTIFYWRDRRRWNASTRSSWQDLEGKTAGAAPPGQIPFDGPKTKSGAGGKYTKYVPRIMGKFSPLGISPFGRARHHLPTDGIEMENNPSSDRALLNATHKGDIADSRLTD
ncbi:hypothetical protein DXG03_006711 [Asterophora parasitica]|uniref:Uncharacterized protein n=1 Tax=Asterophora parasitica TaxID=117018 RepID=A0A9P7KC33_9AGAR|nr:hypothetical protein DXG03_006711 [Asterophora parasitica]